MSEYIKLNNSWVEIYKVFKKINDEWVEQSNVNSSLNTLYVYSPTQIDILEYYIRGVSECTGKSFNLQAIFNDRVVPATWSITSGSQYATVNSNGKVSIVEGTINQIIVVQAVYNTHTDSKTVTISYDNQLTIECADTITGTSGNAIACYNGNIIVPVWTITSGSTYGSISASGEITITSSGTITLSATYNGYTTTKNIELIYDAGSSTETIIDEQGNVTTETTVTTTDPQTGSTTTTITTTTTNEDGSSSSTETSTIENEDGSSETTTTTINSDGSTTESTSTTSAPDENGSTTIEESTSTTNADGTSSETNSTIIENEDGSSESQTTTVNYDVNGDTTGSTENTTTNNADGSSSSSTTNFDENGDPTDQQNVETDTTGNINTQDVEYDSNGDAIVTGYTIDTEASSGSGKDLTGSGVNTEFVPFAFTEGFTMHLRFKSIAGEQPKPPVVEDTEDIGSNYLYNIFSAKSTTKVNNIWPGFDMRWAIAKSRSSSTFQFRRTLVGETSSASTDIKDRHLNNVYDFIITYDPSQSSRKFSLHDNLAKEYALSVNKQLQNDLNLELTIGYALNMQNQPYHYSNVTIYDFSVNRLDSTLSVANPVISCDGMRVTISCATPNALIYYKPYTAEKYDLYTGPILINADTLFYAYTINQHNISSIVTENCIFDDGSPDAPIISCVENTVTITCATTGASIYYRINESGNFILYTTSFEINENTTIEAYSELNELRSSTVLEECDYDDGRPDEPVIYCDGEYVTISCACNATIMYSLDGENYDIYHSSFTIYDDVTVYSYSEVGGLTSDIVSEFCEYTGQEIEHDYSADYLTFTALTSGTISWKALGSGAIKTIEYKKTTDNSWTSITSTSTGATISVDQGDKVLFRGTNTKYCANNKNNYSGFEGGTATYDISGNIMSLIYGDNFANNNTLNEQYAFCSIFKKSNVISAEHLILPALTLTNYAYRAMFSYATQLVTPPALPATTLGKGCYWYMFESCSITSAPELLATTLVAECYGYMFTGCSSLSYIKCLATSGFNTSSCLQNWVNNVAASGSFIKDSNTTWSTGISGIPTGWTVYNDEILADPVIDCDGETITITCETSGASIYYRLNETGEYSLYSAPISINDDTIIQVYSYKQNNQSSIIRQECEYIPHIYKFGDVQFSSGPLYYGINGYEIKDSWNYDSYNSIYGKSNGSYYFNYIEMGQLFEDSVFSTSNGNIENMLDPFDGWRLPTDIEWATIIGLTRSGATVNNTTNKHYAMIELTGVTYAGSSTPQGILLFPDNETITGETLTNMDNSTVNTGITSAQLNTYINQGCVFLPFGGYYNSGWNSGYNYLSSIEYDTTNSNILSLTSSTANKLNSYYPVRLVKNTTYREDTPFEGANQILNSWDI